VPGLVQRGEDRVRPIVEGPVQLQYRNVSPGNQRVVVEEFQQRVIHL